MVRAQALHYCGVLRVTAYMESRGLSHRPMPKTRYYIEGSRCDCLFKISPRSPILACFRPLYQNPRRIVLTNNPFE